MKQGYDNQFIVLPDAAAHSEHGVRIRCEIGPRSAEKSINEYCNATFYKYSLFIIDN
jgi:hypothetical protein